MNKSSFEFAELICQTHYSFLQAASSPEECVRQAVFYNYSALAITDECSVAGVVKAHTEIQKQGLPLKLVIGSLFRFEKLVFALICPNHAAYSELCRTITNARKRCAKGHYQLVEWDVLSLKHNYILWCPSEHSDDNNYWAERFYQHHENRTFLVDRRLLLPNEFLITDQIERLANQYGFPVIASSTARMHEPSRLSLLHVLQAIDHNCQVKDLGRRALINAECCLRPINKLSLLYCKDRLLNSHRLAERCQFSLEQLAYQYPNELVPTGETASTYLRQLVERGIQQRFPEGISSALRDLIEKELALINEQAYEFFFLTIHDIVEFARNRNILYQGRGSAANSVVCYCLGITAVDPRQIDVLFERFISKERDEPPDIDVDFEHERREEVIQYIYNKYGRERTALAATVISFRLKSAIREVGKALGFAEHELSFYINSINRRDRAQSWQEQIQTAGLDVNAEKSTQLLRLVEQIQGCPRHLSQHVGGFVISEHPLYQLVPIENAAMDSRSIIQWDKNDLESLKMLKVDVLALGMLTMIKKAFQLIKQHYGWQWEIQAINRLGDDPQVFKMIQKADTVGVFQIESRAQMNMLPRLRPKTYYDLVIQIAIVRPGPIQGDMVHPYLRRRDGDEAVDYPSTEVQSILERTLGVPIFQEQVIKLAMVAAGFSGGEADHLRRAMAAWKKNGELERFKQRLIDGMTFRGYDVEYALKIYEQICGFGEYGFPESHSASFAVLTYVSCWLKFYFPACFYTSLLNSQPMGFYTASQLVEDAKQHGIKILPVCILYSDWNHQLEKSANAYAIRLGFRLVKNLQQTSVETLTAYRKERGIGSLNEVVQLGLPSSCIEALSSANAFHQLNDNRYQTRWDLMDHKLQLPLFGDTLSQQNNEHYAITPPSDYDDLVEDYASIGLSIEHHPIKLLDDMALLKPHTKAAKLKNLNNGQLVTIIGLVTCRQSPGSAKGITFFTLEDDTGNINVVIWQATARHQKEAYLNAKVLEVKGILEISRRNVIHVIAGRLIDRTNLMNELALKSRSFH